ncbi:TetR/AcrR family transcriptional regulator C-terminal domain-containing protein [Microbacterium foliorum]|uniref:TetR/AcrR family transcriptional regulator C-terminal domain-containing protein n=1 Tax=Microbacterium foliorum TaxID=104336 RepID=UPI00286C2685|nr:TetR/AcrR family transcriptional regulator C-terminal domain-containing protein [Microbacterium foliorum]
MARIVGEALAMVDEGGPNALTMRGLAKRLPTGLAVLYRAVADRGELVELIIDEVLSQADITDLQNQAAAAGGAAWADAVQDAAVRLFATLAAHPGVAVLLAEHVPTGPNALAVRESALQLLLAAGFTHADAARTYATVSRMVIGFAAQLQAESLAEPEHTRTAFDNLDPALFPATHEATDVLANVRIKDEFQYALELLITGLAAHRTATAPTTR